MEANSKDYSAKLIRQSVLQSAMNRI